MGVSYTVSKEEAARILGVSPRRILILLEQEKIKGHVTGTEGKWRIWSGPLLRYKDECEKEGKKP